MLQESLENGIRLDSCSSIWMVETTHSLCKPPIARVWLQCPVTTEITVPHIWTTDRYFGETVITTTHDLHVETVPCASWLQSCGQSMTTVALLICYCLPLCHLLLLLCFLHQVTQPMPSIPATVTNLSNLLHDSLESPGLLRVNISEKTSAAQLHMRSLLVIVAQTFGSLILK